MSDSVLDNSWYKKLSYPKQIVRQLCTYYVKGIYSNTDFEI